MRRAALAVILAVVLVVLSPAAVLAPPVTSAGPCPGAGSGFGFGPGQLCWRTDLNTLSVWNGSTWETVLTESSLTGPGAGQTMTTPGAVTFGNLPGSAPQFSTIGCSDCTKTTPCAGAGGGALAKFIGVAWDCN